MKTADNIKHTINTDLSEKKKSTVESSKKESEEKTDDKRVIKRSKNYDNF